jgi:hypothetical protein
MKKARIDFHLRTSVNRLLSLAALPCFLFLSGCNPTEIQSAGSRRDPNLVSQSVLGKAYVYEDDPVNATGRQQPASFNISKILNSTPQTITPLTKTSLTNDCFFEQLTYFSGVISGTPFVDCIRVLSSDSPDVIPLQPNNGNWIYPPGSTEFYQVQAMYHSNKVIQRLMNAVQLTHEKLHVDGNKSVPPAIPYNLAGLGTWWFKYAANTSLMNKSAQLTVYSTVTSEALRNNAFYEPVSNSIMMGWTAYPGYQPGSPFHVLMVEDTSIMYHEMGHAFMTLFLNYRNVGPSGQPLKYQAFPFLGFYSELGAIGEGVADYFSYAMNARPTIGDWGFGNFVFGRRPMSEDSNQHAPGISLLEDERVSYPDYLLYEPSQPGFPLEDVHNGGFFTSHYLVALTEALKNECFYDHKMAVDHVMLLLADSFSYLGDLTGEGTDFNQTGRYLVNLHPDASYDWYYSVRPITARRWSQAIARGIYHNITRDHCPNFTKEKSERLLDMYGLLLFRHYDDNGTFSDSSSVTANRQDAYAMTVGNGGIRQCTLNQASCADNQFGKNFANTLDGPNRANPTAVDESNRIRSVLVPKSALDHKDGGLFSSVFIDDSARFGNAIASQVLFQGRIISPSVGLAGPEYNNSNNRISPGELLGIGLDLVNRSNIPIGGVSINATPWAHMYIDPTDTSKTTPCSINGFPSITEGARNCTDAEVLPSNGERYKKTGGVYPTRALHPVCLVQTSANNETRWVSQDQFRKNVLQLEDHQCLGYGTPDFTPAECLARFMPGMEMAFMAQIAPQKSYIETLSGPYNAFNQTAPDEDKIPTSQIPGPASSSVLLLEMNKWVPPGTNFTCRLRAQFSNCSDCFESSASSDEYTDIEYAGHKPFKILDLSFLVIE